MVELTEGPGRARVRELQGTFPHSNLTAEAFPLSKRNRNLDLLPGIAVASAFVLLAARLFGLVNLYAVNVFYGDQWDLNEATLFQHHSWWQIFRWQYGPHRQGLGGVFMKLFDPLTHWNSRYEAFAAATVIACACAAALALKQRLFGKIAYSDVITPLLFFTPVQYDTLLGATNPSHGPLPLLLIVLYCLAWTISSTYWKYAAVLSLNVLLIYTGFGLFMGFLTPLLLGLDFYRQRNRLALLSSVIAVLSLGSFFLGYRFNPAVECFSPQLQGPQHYALFVGFMFSSFVNVYPAKVLVPAILLGSVLLVLVSVTAGNALLKLLRTAKPENKCEFKESLVAAALLGYSLIFCFAAAYGRTCQGLAAAQQSRYMIYLVPAFFGLYLTALSAKVRIERRAFVGIVLLLALLSSARVGSQEQRIMATNALQRRNWKECYLSGRGIQECDDRVGAFINWTPEPPDLQSKLDYLRRSHLNLYSDR